MAAKRRYDEDLRAIGQALEGRDISVFELKRVDDLYVIQGIPDQADSLHSKVRQWLRHFHRGSINDPMRLGAVEVEQFSQAGRAKRSKPGQLTDFRTVPNILRTVGAYLDSREVDELLILQKRRISITLSYRDKTGQERQEDRSISSFYRVFLSFAASAARSKNCRYDQTVKFSTSCVDASSGRGGRLLSAADRFQKRTANFRSGWFNYNVAYKSLGYSHSCFVAGHGLGSSRIQN
jgi:hypothetical protein